MLLNEITNIDKLEMLKHELYVILISKKQINGKVYPHQWAEDLCTICFGYTKLVDIWLDNSKDMKDEMQRYNREYNSTISVSANYVDNVVVYITAANNHKYASYYEYASSSSAVSSWAGFWKSRSHALFNKLHELIPQFKFDMFSAIDDIVNQKIKHYIDSHP